MKKNLLSIILCIFLSLSANAEIKIGVSVSATGPAASLGIVEQNTLRLLPNNIDGEPLKVIILDDGSDPTRAVQNA